MRSRSTDRLPFRSAGRTCARDEPAVEEPQAERTHPYRVVAAALVSDHIRLLARHDREAQLAGAGGFEPNLPTTYEYFQRSLRVDSRVWPCKTKREGRPSVRAPSRGWLLSRRADSFNGVDVADNTASSWTSVEALVLQLSASLVRGGGFSLSLR